MNSDVTVYIELPEVDNPKLDEEEFINPVYKKCLENGHRKPDEGVYESDFWFDLFVTPNRSHVWMYPDHPYDQMIQSNGENGEYPCVYLKSEESYGDAVIYEYSIVATCIQSVMEMCDRHNLKIIK
jgi:hypothetical protein